MAGAFSSHSGVYLALAAMAMAVASAVLGVLSLGAASAAGRKVVPFSGGLLIGIALFGILPELVLKHGAAGGPASLSLGVLLLWAFGRFVYPVCPSCSHTHQHELCSTTLHGFATPLVTAASLHSFLDGLGIAASQREPAEALGMAVVLAVMLHKIPEGIALGIMLRAALPARGAALAWCVAAESATVLGALLESIVAPGLVSYALALAGGSFLYLGFHAVHGEWRRRGAPAFMPALTGAAGAAALQQGLHVLLR